MADLTALFPARLVERAFLLLDRCRDAGLRLATAESCTGGLVAGLLTEIPGSSDVVERGFIVYSDQAKHELLAVSEELIRSHGAVSEAVARAMAEGAVSRAPVDLAVAVTGIAGPGGGSAAKPVGLVHFAGLRRGGPMLARHHVFPGDRTAVRLASVAEALAIFEGLIG
jgi:nicotinamide-nucleotide amidase